MKRVKQALMASAVMMVAFQASSQTFFSEDFNTGGTAGAVSRGWEFVLNEWVQETGVDWGVAIPSQGVWPSGSSPGADYASPAGTTYVFPPKTDGTESDSAGGYLLTDSDAAGGSDNILSEAEVWAISPVFSTAGASQVWFHADTEIEFNNNGEAMVFFEATADNGANWHPVWIGVEPWRVKKDYDQLAETSARIDGWPVPGSASKTKSFAGIHGRWHIQFPSEVVNKPQVRFRIGWFESADAWWMGLDNIVIDSSPAPMGSSTILEEDFTGGIPATWGNTAGKTQKWDTEPLWNEEFDEPLKAIGGNPVHVDILKNAEFWGVPLDLDLPDQNFNPGGLTDGRWLIMLAGQDYALWQEGPYAAVGGVNESGSLDTPPLDLRTASQVFLDFDSEWLAGNNTNRYEVLVSTNNGQSFTRIFTYTEALSDVEEAPYFDHHYIPVPAAAGLNNVIFRFRAEGQDPAPDDDPLAGTNGTMAGFWAVDNVRVTATTGGTSVDGWALF